MKKMLRVFTIVMVAMMLTCSVAIAEKKPSKVEMAKLNTMVAAANAAIKTNVRIAQATPYDDTAWLLLSVKAITTPVFRYARSIGAEVICEYDYYVVDGKTLAIDPLKVINIKK